MEQLLAKLTNFSYEIFGVFLPGIIATLLLILLWAAMGPAMPIVTGGIFPELTVDVAADFAKKLMADALEIVQAAIAARN